jgi:hypothetical protein
MSRSMLCFGMRGFEARRRCHRVEKAFWIQSYKVKVMIHLRQALICCRLGTEKGHW